MSIEGLEDIDIDAKDGVILYALKRVEGGCKLVRYIANLNTYEIAGLASRISLDADSIMKTKKIED